MLTYIPNQNVLVYDIGKYILTVENLNGEYIAWLRSKDSNKQIRVARSNDKKQTLQEFMNDLDRDIQKHIEWYEIAYCDPKIITLEDFSTVPAGWTEQMLTKWANTLTEENQMMLEMDLTSRGLGSNILVKTIASLRKDPGCAAEIIVQASKIAETLGKTPDAVVVQMIFDR